MDLCLEDCADGFDNDQDGLLDCEDDECIGAGACPAGYDLRLTADILAMGVAYGPAVEASTGSPFSGFAYGYVELVGVPWDTGDAGFLCEGSFYAMPEGEAPAYYGLSWHTGDTGAACADCDLHIDLSLASSYGALSWLGPCPVRTLPTAHLGFSWQRADLRRRAAGVWDPQYITATDQVSYYGDYFGDGTRVQWMYGLSAIRPYTWSGLY